MYSLPPFPYSTTYNGILLEGIVTHCSLSDITVELTCPYKGIRSGLHTPAFAMFLSNRNLDENGVLSTKGISRIESCLISAYMEAEFLYSNREPLHKRILENNVYLKELNSKLEGIKNHYTVVKKKMKSLLKSNEIMEKEYSTFLRQSREQIADIENGITEVKRSVFAGFQDYRITYGNEEQSIRFVLSSIDPNNKASV